MYKRQVAFDEDHEFHEIFKSWYKNKYYEVKQSPSVHETLRFDLQHFSKPVYKYKKTVLSLHFLKNRKNKEDEITRDDRTSDFILCFDV